MFKQLRLFFVIYSKIANSWNYFIEDMFGMGNVCNQNNKKK